MLIRHQSGTDKAPICDQSFNYQAPVRHQLGTSQAPMKHQIGTNQELNRLCLGTDQTPIWDRIGIDQCSAYTSETLVFLPAMHPPTTQYLQQQFNGIYIKILRELLVPDFLECLLSHSVSHINYRWRLTPRHSGPACPASLSTVSNFIIRLGQMEPFNVRLRVPEHNTPCVMQSWQV